MNKFVLRAAIPIVALLVFLFTLIDFDGENHDLPSIEGSEWIYFCGNPNVYERIVFYPDGSCWYSSKNASGVFKSAIGTYIHDVVNNNIGVRYFKGDRDYMITYKILPVAGSDNYYIGEVYSEYDVRHFIYHDRIQEYQFQQQPSFVNSRWLFSCGTPSYYEQIVIGPDNQVIYTQESTLSGKKISSGTGTLSEDGRKYTVTYTEGERSFVVTYQMFQEERLGRYYLLEKWSDTDLRYFIYDK